LTEHASRKLLVLLRFQSFVQPTWQASAEPQPRAQSASVLSGIWQAHSSRINSWWPGCFLVPCVAACLWFQSSLLSADESIFSRWNLHGTAESAESRDLLSLSPMLESERHVTDRLAADDAKSAAEATEFGSDDFTTEFALPPRTATRSAAFDSDTEDPSEAPSVPWPASTAEFSGVEVQDQFASESVTSPRWNPDDIFRDENSSHSEAYQWQLLPSGLMYSSYLAGVKEARMQFVQLHDTRNDQTYWEAIIGGRRGLVRYGTSGSINPEGFQLDLEAAVFARVLPNEPSAALAASDYRAGLLTTWRESGIAYKAGYYHISSHAGDEFLLANPTFTRINYVRDSLIAGTVYDLDLSSKVYGEIAYAVGHQGGAKPLELQFGAEYTPPVQSSLRGAPFAAVNGHLREDFDFRGGFNLVTGWGWQGVNTRHRMRIGMQYYNGPSLQYQFFDRWENLMGGGLWFDF
jgi:hypothetical protein